MLYPVILVLFLIAGFVLLTYIINVNIAIEYVMEERANGNLAVSVRMIKGLLEFKYEFSLVDILKGGLKAKPLNKRDNEKKSGEAEKGVFFFEEAIGKYKSMRKLMIKNKNTLEYLRKKAVISKLLIYLKVGTGDACHTGIITGMLWAAAGSALSLLLSNVKVLKKQINIEPDFAEKDFKVKLLCIFNVKVVHIIGGAFRYLLSMAGNLISGWGFIPHRHKKA